jgi:hypothetical protein
MSINRFTVMTEELAQRVRLRVAGDAAPGAAAVAWGDHRGTIVLHLSGLKLRATDGWLICNLDANTPGQPISTLQFLFRTAREDEANPLIIAGAIRSDEPVASLADEWGAVLQHIIWDGVLDIMEGVVNHAGKQSPGRALTLLGFLASEGAVQVEVQVAEA